MITNDTKQAIVIRTDVKMRKGKMVSQGSHSSMKVFFDRGHMEGNNLVIPMTDDMVEWYQNIFTKVALKVGSEAELLAIHEMAESLGIPCSLIQDVGLTVFDGVPTYTAVAVGPAKNEDIDKVCGGLPLL